MSRISVKFNGNPDPKKRFGHGFTFTYLFSTPNGSVTLSCVYDSTRFATPGMQIIHENQNLILSLYHDGHPITPIVGFAGNGERMNCNQPYRRVPARFSEN